MDRLDLAQLACWERVVHLDWEGRQVPVLLRIVGDRGAALEAGFARMEQELARWGPGTVRRRALQALLLALPAADLVEEALAAELPALERAVERKLPHPPLRRDLEAGETPAQFAARRACWQEEAAARLSAREALLGQMCEERRLQLVELPREELVEAVLPSRLQEAAWQGFEEAAMELVLAQACRQPEPPHELVFGGPEQVRSLPGAVRQALAEAYRALDPGMEGDLPKG